jgi:predicted DNA-binding transcriptional regulator YafY
MVAIMGQRTPTETLFGIVAAFVEKRTWKQAELARRLETKPETIRKHLGEMQSGGFKLEREEEHPHVFWSVPKDWFPGALLFKTDEVPDLLRVLGRAPKSKGRDRLLEIVAERLQGRGAVPSEGGGVHPPEVTEDEERWLAVIEDAVRAKAALKLRYFTTSTRNESWRHVSPHRIDLGARPTLIATCHKAKALRRFRVSNVLEARIDASEPFRSATQAALDELDAASLAGFRQAGPKVACSFFVRDPEAVWVARNLPDPQITHERAEGGARFLIQTPGVEMLARYVVGLGSAARAETPELSKEVEKLAKGALANLPGAGPPGR